VASRRSWPSATGVDVEPEKETIMEKIGAILAIKEFVFLKL
jgi:hypothetical protein